MNAEEALELFVKASKEEKIKLKPEEKLIFLRAFRMGHAVGVADATVIQTKEKCNGYTGWEKVPGRIKLRPNSKE